jgi:drug/metabolite transporter (DMT)-like permease
MPIVLALCSAVVYGVGDWCGGRASRRQPSVIVAVTGQIVSLLLVGAVLLIMRTAAPGASTWWWSAGGGVVGALGLAGLYHGLSHGDITVVAPVSAVVATVVPVVAALVIGERPSPVGYFGIALVVVAVALVSGAIGRHQHSTPPVIVLLSVFVGVCFGLLFVAFSRAAHDSGVWPLIIARFASVPMLLAMAAAGRLRPASDSASMRIAVVAGVFDMGANMLYLIAARGGMLSIVGAVSSLYPASTVALAFAVDKERVGRWQAVGLALAAVALVLVSISRR